MRSNRDGTNKARLIPDETGWETKLFTTGKDKIETKRDKDKRKTKRDEIQIELDGDGTDTSIDKTRLHETGLVKAVPELTKH